ncbi:MAG: DinB family protein [Anaerolineae bacterium]
MAGSARAQQMANRFQWLNDQVIAFVEPLTEEQWAMPCGDDHRPIGVVAHHVATAYGAFTRWVATMANGQPLPPVTLDVINNLNAQHAETNAAVGKIETVDLLRQNGGAAVAAVSNLSDEDLARSGTMPLLGDAPVTTAQLIGGLLMAHTNGHLTAMRGALGR